MYFDFVIRLVKRAYKSSIGLFVFIVVAFPFYSARGEGRLPNASTVLRVSAEQTAYGKIDLKGWDSVFFLLRSQGVDGDYLLSIFRDPRMPKRRPLEFSTSPTEHPRLYSGKNNPSARRNAYKFFSKYQNHFVRARQLFGVPENLLLSLLQIETQCGEYTGRKRVFYRLSRLVSATNFDSVRKSYARNLKKDPKTSIFSVYERAVELRDIFLPHLIALIDWARREGLNPLEIRGSGAGAVGIPQFLPGNALRFGVDGDGDGKVDLFNPPDAILSTANFLAGHGWRKVGMSKKEMMRVLKNYNASDPYVSTVLSMAKDLKPLITGLKSRTTRLPTGTVRTALLGSVYALGGDK